MARTLSTEAAAVLGNPNHGGKIGSLSVFAADETTVVADLRDWVVAVDVQEDADSPRTATLRLFRAIGDHSLSPLIIPEDFSFLGSAYLQPARRVLLTVTLDSDSGGFQSFVPFFDGYIDQLAWAGDDEVVLTLTDRTAKLRDTWIESERAYGFAQGVNATKGCLVWRGDLPPIALNDLVIPSDARRNGHFYKATTVAGAQGATEPSWPTGSGATVVSGGVTFTEAGSTHPTTGAAVETIISQILADNGLGSHTTLQVPVSPAWNVKPFLQDRTSVLDAVARLAEQMGWVLRFDWNSGGSKFDLFLREPARAAGSAVRTFAVDQVAKIEEATIDVFRIRNAVRVTFGDSAVLTAEGRPTRKAVDRTDAPSIARYRRRYTEIQEADASNIDTITEAQRMADAMLADLKEPLVQVRAEIPFDPYLELGDRVTLPADRVHWSSSQTLAITSLSWAMSVDGWTTKLGLRGTPVAGVDRWLGKEGRANPGDLHRLALLQVLSPPTLTVDHAVGGGKVSVDGLVLAKDANQFNVEMHVGSPGFSASPSTLKNAGQQTSCVISNLVPGKSYEARVYPYTRNGDRIVRGEASAALAFVAGRTSAGHYLSTVSQGHFPLNGNFEHATDDLASFPPDHWTPGSPTQGGTWGAAADLYHSTDATYGRTLLIRNTAVNAAITSSPFPVRRGMRFFALAMAYRTVSGMVTGVGRQLVLTLRFYRKSDLSDAPILFTVNAESTAAAAGTWTALKVNGPTLGTLPSDVNFATLTFHRSVVATDLAFEIGDVFFMEGGVPEEMWPDLREVWLTVGGTGVGWNANWQNFGGGWQTTAYMKDPLGFVRLRGLAQTTVVRAAGSTPFTLPAGYRPALSSIFSVITGGAGAAIRCDVSAAGVVSFPANGLAINEWVSLDGVTFDTR